MRPPARLQAAIEIVGALAATDRPADRFLRDWFRARRYAGSKDRAAISGRVFAVLRRWYSLSWRMGSDAARALVIASLSEEMAAAEIESVFDGSPYGPPPLSADERGALAALPAGDPPLHVQGEFPPFLEPELARAFGPHVIEEMRAMGERAPVDLRANTLKTTRQDLAAALRQDGFAPEPTLYSPWGLRLPAGEGLSKLSATPLFADGAFEFQDEAAQIAALLCAAKPGLRVLDFAAGAGGKTLALAAAMQNRGEILAHDIDSARLARLGLRALRAGATIVSTGPPAGTFDRVLLDSPCSGTGTWRRQPELRWRLTPARLAELTALQDRLLDEAAPFVAPGGRLLYATCSVLKCENEDRIARFRAGRPDFAPVSAAEVWLEAVGTQPPPGMDACFRASPLLTGTDGFFAAILRRAR